MKTKTLSLSFVAAFALVALSGCTAPAPEVTPTATPTPTETPTVSTITAEEAWTSFTKVSDASCLKAYNGLIEEDVEGPDTGKLKIRLTWEQAGENSIAYQRSNGESGLLENRDFFACEASDFIHSWPTDGDSFSPEVPPYSADFPIRVEFDNKKDVYLTTQITRSGDLRELSYKAENGVFSLVENLNSGSKTKLTFGLPNAAMEAIVNDYYGD